MTEISIENNIDKNIENNITNEDSTVKQTSIQNSDLLKNEQIPDDYIVENIDTKIDQPKTITPTKYRLYMKVGRTFFLFLDKYSNPIFIIGPHWPMIIFVLTLITSLMLLLYIKFWNYLTFSTRVFGSINFWLAFLSYTYTSLINPGYPRNTLGRAFGIPKNEYYFCDYCRFYMRKLSYGTHCDFCNICIEKYDHHCVWTGHCIGKNNKIGFFIFVPSIFILLCYYGYAFSQGLSRK